MKKVFISTTTFAEIDPMPLKLLEKAKVGYDRNTFNRKLKKEEIMEILKNGKYIGLIAGTEQLDKDVLKDAKYLKVISRVGVGLENIDLDAANKLGIKVFNTPFAPVDAVAELTIGLILCSLRRICIADRNIRKGKWEKKIGALFKDKILGIIGMGRIGKRVAELACAFGARIVFYDLQEVKSSFCRKVTFNKLLKISDIISIHASAGKKIITEKEFTLMKDGVIIINTSRGEFIDEEALYQTLNSGKVAFAALDTFEKEPYSGKLIEFDNVVLTPHIGSYAKEARIEMEIQAVENLFKGLNEK